jgi:DNA polymerase III delta prime subunit
MSDVNYLNDLVWFEKFRPDKVGFMILPNEFKRFFNKIIKKEIPFPNLLLHSTSPGSGKTTIAKALCKELEIDYLYINVSLHNGIDTLREDIARYATNASYDNNIKCVILDEFDGATMALQKALRAAIEDYVEVCRFIITCNNIAQIFAPIISRMEVFHFDFGKYKEEMLPKISNRLIKMLEAESVKYDAEAVKKVVEYNYPDIRSMINLLQQYKDVRGEINAGIVEYKMIDMELVDLIMTKKISLVRKFIADHQYDISQMYRFMFDNVVPKIEDPVKKGRAIIFIAGFMDQHTTSIDKEITLTACLIELAALL